MRVRTEYQRKQSKKQKSSTERRNSPENRQKTQRRDGEESGINNNWSETRRMKMRKTEGGGEREGLYNIKISVREGKLWLWQWQWLWPWLWVGLGPKQSIT